MTYATQDEDGVRIDALLSAIFDVNFLPFDGTVKNEHAPTESDTEQKIACPKERNTLRRVASVGDYTAISSVTLDTEEIKSKKDQVNVYRRCPAVELKTGEVITKNKQKRKSKKINKKGILKRTRKIVTAGYGKIKIASVPETVEECGEISFAENCINNEVSDECSTLTLPTTLESLETSVREIEKEIERLQYRLAEEKRTLAEHRARVPQEISLDVPKLQDDIAWKAGTYCYMRICDLASISGDWSDLNSLSGPQVMKELSDVALTYVDKPCGGDGLWTPANNVAKKNGGTLDSRSDDVALWEGKPNSFGFKSDLPAYKACGIIECAACELYNLVVDSNRVKEYNKISIGRIDEHVFAGSVDEGLTKVMRSITKPQVSPKPIELITILHTRKLNEGNKKGWLCVSRGVRKKADFLCENGCQGTEVLLGLNLIEEFDIGDGVKRTKFTTITKLFSPNIPIFVAKRFAPRSTTQYICNIRNAMSRSKQQTKIC